MPAPSGLDTQRSGLALVLAALRHDHDAVARLVTAASHAELLALTVFCAQFAAEKCREAERPDAACTAERALQIVSLQLAARADT